MESYDVPLSNGEVVNIAADELPEETGQILDMFRHEQVPLPVWRRIAVGYLKRSMTSQFEEVMRAGAVEAESNELENKDERISMIQTLAAHLVGEAGRTGDPKARDELFKDAIRLLNNADRIDLHNPMAWATKGALHLAQARAHTNESDVNRDVENAKKWFDNCLQVDKGMVPALLSMATINYHYGKYRKALELYKKLLRSHPNCNPRVRFGMGLCMLQLGHPKRAREAFKRTLELDPSCADALVALALLDLNDKDQGDTNERIKNGMKLLNRAYKTDKTNSMVLNHLSNYFFFKDESDKVLKLAMLAQKTSEVKPIKAEAYYNMARVQHSQGDFHQAASLYKQSIAAWPKFVLPHFGLALTYLDSGDDEKALRSLEQVNKLSPDNFETMKLLGVLYASMGRTEKAEEKLTSVTELYPMDAEGWEEFARLLLQKNSPSSLESYENALRLTLAGETPPSVELLNNVGVLRAKAGHLDAASEAFRQAAEATGKADEPYSLECVTVTFNRARLHEAKHEPAEAEALYKGILEHHPSYTDCHLRLGMMRRAAGDVDGASEWFKEAIGVDQNCADAWTLWGNLHLDRREWHPAQRKFERVTQLDRDRADPYAKLALGGLHYQMVRPGHEKEEKYIKVTRDCAYAVLKGDPKNVYAAHLLGVVLSEKGFLDAGIDVFTQVKEAAGDMPEVLINLAHLALNKKDYRRAISLYTSCLKRFYNNQNVRLFQYAAFANFEAGKVDECVRILRKAVHLAPNDRTLRYNLAIAHYNVGNTIVKNKGKGVLIREMRRATAATRFASKTLEHLLNSRQKGDLYLEDHCRAYLKKCTFCLGKIEKLLERAEGEEERKMERRREKERLAKEQEARELAARQREEAEKRAAEELKMQQLLEAKEKLATMMGNWENQQVADEGTNVENKRSGDASNGVPKVAEGELFEVLELQPGASDSSDSSDDEDGGALFGEPSGAVGNDGAADENDEHEEEEPGKQLGKRGSREVTGDSGSDVADADAAGDGGDDDDADEGDEPTRKRQRRAIVDEEDDDDDDDDAAND